MIDAVQRHRGARASFAQLEVCHLDPELAPLKSWSFLGAGIKITSCKSLAVRQSTSYHEHSPRREKTQLGGWINIGKMSRTSSFLSKEFLDEFRSRFQVNCTAAPG